MKRALFTTALFALLLMCGGVAKGQNDTLPDIMIGGIAITESNDSIVGDCISGHVSYDALTNIMTLDNATISENVSFWRNSHIKIKLLGNNFIQNLIHWSRFLHYYRSWSFASWDRDRRYGNRCRANIFSWTYGRCDAKHNGYE